MTPIYFVGIDISKLTLDVAVMMESTLLFTRKIENTEAGVRGLVVSLKAELGCTAGNTIYCAEHMGIYGKFLRDITLKKHLRLCLENPLQIWRSIGIQRAKTDRLDAIRIAGYAHKNAASLRFWTAPRLCIQRLRMLISIRRKLVKMRSMLKSTRTVEEYFFSAAARKEIGKYTNGSVASITVDVGVVEAEMARIVQDDAQLLRLMNLMTSIPYVGTIVAIHFLVLSNEFRDIQSPGCFASFCGIAPFPRSSGTSVNRKPRISHIANKDMKTMLHLAAMGSTRKGVSRFHDYYARKVKEGKHKMVVINAVRNKLVRVVFACVRDNRTYQEHT